MWQTLILVSGIIIWVFNFVYLYWLDYGGGRDKALKKKYNELVKKHNKLVQFVRELKGIAAEGHIEPEPEKTNNKGMSLKIDDRAQTWCVEVN